MDRPWEPVDKQLSETVSSYWVNFAKTGNPNGAGLPPWPAYTPSSHTTMQLGVRTGVMDTAEAAKLDFLLGALQNDRHFLLAVVFLASATHELDDSEL